MELTTGNRWKLVKNEKKQKTVREVWDLKKNPTENNMRWLKKTKQDSPLSRLLVFLCTYISCIILIAEWI